MNLQLRILKGKTSKDFYDRRSIRFAVIDQDVSKSYPANFVCILPQHMNTATADSSVFAKTFKDGRIAVAGTLLKTALQTELDPEIRKEIVNRLRHLQSRQVSRIVNAFDEPS